MVNASSEIVSPFPEAPVSLSDFFRSNVQRLLQDNLDYVITEGWDNKSLQALHIIDRSPIPGGRLHYHYAYEVHDSSEGTSTLGVVLETPRLLLPTKFTNKGHSFAPWAQRRNSRRHYFDTDQGLGIVASHYKVPGHLYADILEGVIEEPRLIDDVLDDRKVSTLKADLKALREGYPVKPISNLVRHNISL